MFFRELSKSITRSSGWRKVRASFLILNPRCAVCKRKATEVHHIVPFHTNPALELDPSNLISFCSDHHLLFGHLMDWKNCNTNVIEDSKLWKSRIQPPQLTTSYLSPNREKEIEAVTFFAQLKHDNYIYEPWYVSILKKLRN